MFIDRIEIEVKGGDGGNGAVSFRREKYVPRGGPDGGDGGVGGNVVLEVDPHLSTLLEYRYKRRYVAQRGGDGHGKQMSGKAGADLVLKVPPGTIVFDADTGEQIADLTHAGQRAVAARGGAPGRGNMHFATSVHQAPKFADRGDPGEERRLRLELKLLADVALLGFPSVGKSTLIAAVSAARPKIADYPFTTLVPNLGVVAVEDEGSFVLADLPGLIEGAHEGAGLGHQFLRHVERARVLAHLLDVSGMTGRDPLDDFRIINREIRLHDERLASLPQVVVLNKIDVATDPEAIDAVERALAGEGYEVHRISAATRQGLDALVYALWSRVEAARATAAPLIAEDTVRISAQPAEDPRRWEVQHVAEHEWLVEGPAVERRVQRTDIGNEYALERLQRSLERLGVYRKLKDLGAMDGDTVRIGAVEFDYIDDDLERDDRRPSARHRS